MPYKTTSTGTVYTPNPKFSCAFVDYLVQQGYELSHQEGIIPYMVFVKGKMNLYVFNNNMDVFENNVFQFAIDEFNISLQEFIERMDLFKIADSTKWALNASKIDEQLGVEAAFVTKAFAFIKQKTACV